MEIILKANVPHLGKMLDVVKVKDGYARNYLFPRKHVTTSSRVSSLFAQLRKPSLKSKTTALLLKLSSRRNSLPPAMLLQSSHRFLSTSNAALLKANVSTVL